LKCVFVILSVALTPCLAISPCTVPVPPQAALSATLNSSCVTLCASCVNTVHDLLMGTATCLNVTSNFTNNLSDISGLSRSICVIISPSVSLKHTLRLGLGPVPTNNCVTVNSSSVENIETGIGDDFVYLLNYADARDIKTGPGNDSVVGKNATIRTVHTGSGSDFVNCSDCNITGSVDLGSGNDYLKINGSGVVTRRISGGSGKDEILLSELTVGLVDLGDGPDFLGDYNATIRRVKGSTVTVGVDPNAFIREFGTDSDDAHIYCTLP